MGFLDEHGKNFWITKRKCLGITSRREMVKVHRKERKMIEKSYFKRLHLGAGFCCLNQ